MSKLNKTMKIVLALAVIMMLTGSAAALVFHSVSGNKMYLASNTFEESAVVITGIVPVVNGDGSTSQVQIYLDNGNAEVIPISISISVLGNDDTAITSGQDLWGASNGIDMMTVNLSPGVLLTDIASINAVLTET